MLSLYRAWLGPSPCVSRPVPPPGAHRPVPVRALEITPPNTHLVVKAVTPPRVVSPSSSTSSELDVEGLDSEPPRKLSTVLDVASCDGPVRFSRVLNEAWREGDGQDNAGWYRQRKSRVTSVQYYPCKTCGCKFPSYYFVHKHRKLCHAEEEALNPGPDPEGLGELPGTSTDN